MEIFDKGIKSFTYSLIGSFLGVFVQFLAAKFLGVFEYGKASYILGYASTISIFFYFGINFYFSKIFQGSKLDKKIIFSGTLLAATLIFVIFSLVFYFFISKKVSTIDFICLLIIAWLLFVLEYLRAFYIAEQNAPKAARYGNFYLRIFFMIFFLLSYLFIGKSEYSLLLSYILAICFIVIPFLVKKFKFTKPDFKLIYNAKTFYFVQIFYFFFNGYGKVLQGNLFSMKSVGLLSISLVIGAAVTMIGANLGNVAMPLFAKTHGDGNKALLEEDFLNISRINAFLIIPIFIFFLVNAGGILGIIGNDYVKAKLILILILSGNFFGSLVGPNGTVLLMTGKEKFELLNGITKIIVGGLIIYILGRRVIWGVAFAIAMAEIISNLLKALEVYLFNRILPFKMKTLMFLTFLTIIQIGVFYLISTFIYNIYLEFSMSLILVIIFWFLSFFYSPYQEDKSMVVKTLSRVSFRK